MRIALISDIHGNHIALDAVLADIRREHVDSLIFLGDLATTGPHPRQVMDTLKGLHCPSIMGNHDEALLNPAKAESFRIAPNVVSSIYWCLERMTGDDLYFLRSFQPTFQVTLSDRDSLLCFHGTPRSNILNIYSTSAADKIDSAFADNWATVMIGGHTHVQMIRPHNGRLIVNAGSVGSAFVFPPNMDAPPRLLPWAEYAIVAYEHGRVSVDLRRVPFDMTAYLRDIEQSDLPLKEWWLTAYLPSAR